MDIDQNNDGLHFRVSHRAHGMNAFNNWVTIDKVKSDIPPTDLDGDYAFNSVGDILVTSQSNFDQFEGVGVGTTNFGYLQIGNEIMSYTGTSNKLSLIHI